jgi:hypothetical protein
MIENIDYQSLKADTLRFSNVGNKFLFSGKSPNCGLLCYLCESMLNSNNNLHPYQSDIKVRVEELIGEAQMYKGRYFWGWEKYSSIPGVYFPIDWDDTSKSLDFLFLASSKGLINLNKKLLPDNKLWESEIMNSFFYSDYTGEDVKIKHKKYLALSVFFGPLSDKWIKRDDPMVTLALIRTTKLWFPNAFYNLSNEFHELIDKLIFITNYLLKNKITFDKISRYYYSFGHFIYRLIETLKLVGYEHKNIFDTNLYINIDQSVFNLLNNRQTKSHEDLLWYLIGLKTRYLFSDELISSIPLKHSLNQREYIFRHRRLNHYYLAEHWYEKLFFWEYNKIQSDIIFNNSFVKSFKEQSVINI